MIQRLKMLTACICLALLLCMCQASTSDHKDGEIGYALAFHKLDSTKSPFGIGGGGAPPTRKLLQSGCSDTDNSVYAIVQCTNYVRSNPDLLANEYPCHYNSWRHDVVGKNLPMLNIHGTLERMAQLHADDQARAERMSHTGSDGSTLGIRADRVNLAWGSLGENVAVGFQSAKQVVMAWMCSAGHRKNLMSCKFDQIGIGIAGSTQGRNYYAQNFVCVSGNTCNCDGHGAASPLGHPILQPQVHPLHLVPQHPALSPHALSPHALSPHALAPRAQPIPTAALPSKAGRNTHAPWDQNSVRSAILNGLDWRWKCGWENSVWDCSRVPADLPTPHTAHNGAGFSKSLGQTHTRTQTQATTRSRSQSRGQPFVRTPTHAFAGTPSQPFGRPAAPGFGRSTSQHFGRG